MRHAEFPHVATFLKSEKVQVGGGSREHVWEEAFATDCFLATPTTREVYQAQQLNNTLDRNLYYPYRTDITPDMRVVSEGHTFEAAGRPMDLGGQHEIMKLPLKLVLNGA